MRRGTVCLAAVLRPLPLGVAGSGSRQSRRQRENKMSIADDLVANIQAGHELFVAGMRAADENSARKLAALIRRIERIAESSHSEWVCAQLTAAIAEARKP